MPTPWYLAPAALRVIARLKATPPQRVGNTCDNPLQTNSGHHSAAAADLRAMFTVAAHSTPHDQWDGLFDTSADEVLAALFGCPDGLDWAHPARAARRAALAIEIDEALAQRLAA